MSIASEIARLQQAKADIKTAIENKGVTVAEGVKIDTYSEYIDQIPQGGTYDPICFTSLEDGNTFQLNKKIAISVDGKQTWQTLSANTDSPTINTGEKIYFRATDDAVAFAGTTSNYYKFKTAKKCNVSGNPYSLYAEGSLYFFAYLFNDTKIVNANELTLSEYIRTESCFSFMFSGCIFLVNAPELPSTILAPSCYLSMFGNCPSLVNAPELPATTLVANCYQFMFKECTALNYIKALFMTTPSNSYTEDWVLGVAATGTFVKNSEATWTTTGINGVPTGWTVEVDD